MGKFHLISTFLHSYDIYLRNSSWYQNFHEPLYVFVLYPAYSMYIHIRTNLNLILLSIWNVHIETILTFWLLYKNNWSLFESWNFQGFWVTFNYRCRSDHRFPKLSRRKSLGQSLVVKRLCSTTDEKSWARWIFYLRRGDIFRHEWSVGDTWEIYEMTW